MIEDLFVEPSESHLSGRVKDNIVRNEIPTLNPAIRTIPVFKKILANDRGSVGDADGSLKLQAGKEIAFIYHFTNPFRFAAYDDDIRAEKCKALVGLDPKWVPGDDVVEAVNLIAELILTSYPELVAVNRTESVLRTYIELLELKDQKNKEFLRQFRTADATKMTITQITEITQAIEAISDEIPKTMKTLKELKPAINDVLDIKKEVEYYIKTRKVKVLGKKSSTSPFDTKHNPTVRTVFK